MLARQMPAEVVSSMAYLMSKSVETNVMGLQKRLMVMKFELLLALVATVLLQAGSCGRLEAAQPVLPNAILFVTQVPIATEINDANVSNVFASAVSPFGNHLADTAHAGRGGDLWLRYPDGTLK